MTKEACSDEPCAPSVLRPSVSVEHVVNVVQAILAASHRNQVNSDPITILDLGCGDGKLLNYLAYALPKLNKNLCFDFYGLDISDSRQQSKDFMKNTVLLLQDKHPRIDWNKKLNLITEKDKWPYQDSYFNFIVSNQVMEHVADHRAVFQEIHRCLLSGGMSINVFPTREALWEQHALMPFVHKIRNEKKRAWLMLNLARLGFKSCYKLEKASRRWNSLEDFARIYAHVLETDTNYLTSKQLTTIATRAGLSTSFTYTKDLFIAKALSFIGKKHNRYKTRGVIIEPISISIGRMLGSVTLLLEKKP